MFLGSNWEYGTKFTCISDKKFDEGTLSNGSDLFAKAEILSRWCRWLFRLTKITQHFQFNWEKLAFVFSNDFLNEIYSLNMRCPMSLFGSSRMANELRIIAFLHETWSIRWLKRSVEFIVAKCKQLCYVCQAINQAHRRDGQFKQSYRFICGWVWFKIDSLVTLVCQKVLICRLKFEMPNDPVHWHRQTFIIWKNM